MSQNDLSIANQGFPAFRSDLNSALQALGSTNSGTSAPSTTYANQLWYDTTNNILYIRNEDNDAWIKLFTLDQANDNVESLHGDTIAEATSGSGVTIDSVLLKDGELGSTSSAVPIHSSSLNDGQFGGRRNILYNPKFDIYQRGSKATTDGNEVYSLDRWLYFLRGGAIGTITQDTDVPTGEGFAHSMKLDVTTADALGTANDFCVIKQKIEGQDLQKLAYGTSSAKTLTLSFWIKTTITGTYVVELFNTDATRQQSQSYTVSSSNTWEQKTVTFTADTANGFTDDVNESLAISWGLGFGSDYTSGTLNTTWGSSTNANRFVGQVNALSNTANNIYLCGCQLEIGSTKTDFEHRTFFEEHQLCRRYMQKSYDVGVAPGTSTTTGQFNHNFLNLGNFGNVVQRFGVSMRVAPTMTVYDGAGGTVNTIRYYDGSSETTRTTNFSLTSSTEQWNMADDTFNHTNIVFQWVAIAEL